jgi:hypothetical protein
MLSVLIVMVFPASLLLGMDRTVIPTLILTLVLGVPVLVLLGGMMGAIGPIAPFVIASTLRQGQG